MSAGTARNSELSRSRRSTTNYRIGLHRTTSNYIGPDLTDRIS